MQELIRQLTEKAGISPEQAEKVLHTVSEFVKEKFPMMAGAVDNLFAQGGDATDKGGDMLNAAKDKLSGLFGG
jgi:hypothetical protein